MRIRGARIGGQLVLRGGLATGPVAYTGVPRDSTLEEWLDLLANRTRQYASQPYHQLAAAHQAAGHERDVRRIGIAQQRDLRRPDRGLRVPAVCDPYMSIGAAHVGSP